MSGDVKFTDKGCVICESRRADHERKFLRFWDSETGELIAQHPTLNGGGPAFVASNGTRVLAMDERYINGINEEADRRWLRAQEVWDFRTQKRVARWDIRWQKLEQPYPAPRNIADAPYTVDISPSGQLIAEAGDGVLRMYRVQQ